MQQNGTQPDVSLRPQLHEGVRLLWEGTRKTLDDGIDPKDLVSLCDIIVRVADQRLLIIQATCGAEEGEEAAKQIKHFRDLAAEVLREASKPAPEPDWNAVAESLASDGAAPLEFPCQSR